MTTQEILEKHPVKVKAWTYVPETDSLVAEASEFETFVDPWGDDLYDTLPVVSIAVEGAIFGWKFVVKVDGHPVKLVIFND